MKLKNTLKDDENMIYYFNAKHGFKILVDSFEFGLEALDIISEILPSNQKLREDFQRQHLYEAMIDFMHKKNVNAEGATLEPAAIEGQIPGVHLV